MHQHFTASLDEPRPAIKVTCRSNVVSATDGRDIRMHGCQTSEAATMLAAQLKADPVAALRWMTHVQPIQLELPLIGGKLRRTEDQV